MRLLTRLIDSLPVWAAIGLAWVIVVLFAVALAMIGGDNASTCFRIC